MIGRNSMVVAVLLVISVINEITNARIRIKKKISNSPNTNKLLLIHSAKPVEVIKLAKLNPPPKRINIFQGILLNQSLSNKKFCFLNGIRKKRTAPKTAIPESLIDRSKNELMKGLKTHKKMVVEIISNVTFSFEFILYKNWKRVPYPCSICSTNSEIDISRINWVFL